MNKAQLALTKAIEAAQRIALILHVSPDGDACGSALALRRAFVLRGKAVDVLCDDRIPRLYLGLDGAKDVLTPEALANEPAHDLALAVDVGDRGRLGRSARVFDAARHTAQIDHHTTNPGYAEINVLRSPLSATGVLAYELLEALGIPLDLPLAQCLFSAVASDTGNFKQQNTDTDALELAAKCVAAGVDVQETARRLFDLRPLCQNKLIARALFSMETICDGRISMMQLTREDFLSSGALAEHNEGIVGFGINTEGVKIACLLCETSKGVKCSLRALPPYDVASVAISLGGGGHVLAAGCSVSAPLCEVNRMMRIALAKALEAAQ